MTTTNIEWTDKTWNPVTGCTKVSPGCAHCYAEGVAERFWAKQYPPVSYVTCSNAAGCTHEDGTCNQFTESRPRVFEDVQTHADRLDQPLRWKKPARVFVNSMSDLFHEDVPDEFIDQVFAVMALAPQHTFQILTKRAERMRAYLRARDVRDRVSVVAADAIRDPDPEMVVRFWPLLNVWLGVSIENQHFADERLPLLRDTPAAVRFLSVEPMLGPVDFVCDTEVGPLCQLQAFEGTPGIDWVIVGGESGAGARRFDIAWARSIIAQCRAAKVPVFVKQLGAKPFEMKVCPFDPMGPEPAYLIIKSAKGGDVDEWPEDLRVREFPTTKGTK